MFKVGGKLDFNDEEILSSLIVYVKYYVIYRSYKHKSEKPLAICITYDCKRSITKPDNKSTYRL